MKTEYPEYTDETVEFEHDGVTFELKMVPDDNPDLSWLGDIGHKAVDHPYQLNTCGRDGNNVLVGTDGECRYGPYEDQTPENAVYVMQDLERLAAYAREEWMMVGAVVIVSRQVLIPRNTVPPSSTIHVVELGSASLWGIESDSGDYFAEVFDELTDEALEDARATLELLTSNQ